MAPLMKEGFNPYNNNNNNDFISKALFHVKHAQLRCTMPMNNTHTHTHTRARARIKNILRLCNPLSCHSPHRRLITKPLGLARFTGYFTLSPSIFQHFQAFLCTFTKVSTVLFLFVFVFLHSAFSGQNTISFAPLAKMPTLLLSTGQIFQLKPSASQILQLLPSASQILQLLPSACKIFQLLPSACKTFQLLSSASQLSNCFLQQVNFPTAAFSKSIFQLLPSASQLSNCCLQRVNYPTAAFSKSIFQLLPSASQISNCCLQQVKFSN